MWNQDISIGDLHYIRSKFAEEQGAFKTVLPMFNKITEQFYNNKLFAVNGEDFITWAYLSPQMEINYLSGHYDWIEEVTSGRLWLIEARIKGSIFKSVSELSQFTSENIALAFTNNKIRRFILCHKHYQY